MEELTKELEKYYRGEEFSAPEPEAGAAKALGEYIAAGRTHDLPKTLELLGSLYPEGDELSRAVRFLSDCGVAGAAAIFAADIELSGLIKNHYMSSLTEQVRFAKAQRANLKDTASYNRHVEKALPVMCFELKVMFALGADLSETKLVLDKYFEYNYYVNREQNWLEFYMLSEYAPFREFMEGEKEELLRLYSRTNIELEGVRYLLESGSEPAIRIYFENIAEAAAVSRANADGILQKTINFPFDAEIVVRFADMFDGLKRASAQKWFAQNRGKYADMAFEIAQGYLE